MLRSCNDCFCFCSYWRLCLRRKCVCRSRSRRTEAGVGRRTEAGGGRLTNDED